MIPAEYLEDDARLKAAIRKIPRTWFRADLRVLAAQAVADLLVLVVGGAVCLAVPQPVVWTVTWTLMAGRIHGLAILMHDLTHVRALESRPLTKLLFDMFVCWPAVMNMDYYGLAHRHHHRQSNLPRRDPYFVHLHRQNPFGYPLYVVVGSLLLIAILILRLAVYPLTLVWPAFRRLHIHYFSQLGASPDLDNPARDREGEAIWIWALGPTVFWYTVLGCVHTYDLWRPFTVAYGAPLLLSAILGQVRLACDHIYTEALGNSTMEQLAGATNIVAPWWQQIVLGAHGASYHALHHLLPTLPNHRFEAVHALLMQSGSDLYRRTEVLGYHTVIVRLLCAQWAWTRAGGGFAVAVR